MFAGAETERDLGVVGDCATDGLVAVEVTDIMRRDCEAAGPGTWRGVELEDEVVERDPLAIVGSPAATTAATVRLFSTPLSEETI